VPGNGVAIKKAAMSVFNSLANIDCLFHALLRFADIAYHVTGVRPDTRLLDELDGITAPPAYFSYELSSRVSPRPGFKPEAYLFASGPLHKLQQLLVT